jgi:ABC-type transport system involved in multi-copper enzyme maturation permease subunit
LLHYRPWHGTLRTAGASIIPIARIAVGMMIRRKLFWVLYGLGLLFFLLFFFGQYLLAYAEAQGPDPANSRNNQGEIVKLMRNVLKLDGSGESYRTFFNYQGNIVMVILALAGSIVIGNDVRFGSLPYYLSKPLSRWHYLSGKALAVGIVVNLLTTVPALVLFVQYGLIYTPPDATAPSYFEKDWALVFGILAYGATLTVSLCLLLLATAMWVRKTVPLIMIWSTLFYFCRIVCDTIVDRLNFNRHWRLFDLWNDTVLVGNKCLGILPGNADGQPEWYLAALVLGGVSCLCLTYLILRIRAVEIVR